jgi:HAMP domain-containing protein
MILATMLLIAGGWSIYELKNIGLSVQNILDENYRSIDASKVMIESLERADSAVLLILLGRKDEGLAILEIAEEHFQKAYETAGNNVTISGEQSYVEAVGKAYAEYRESWPQVSFNPGNGKDSSWYIRESNPSFLKAKQTVSDLLDLNTRVMYKMASHSESRAHRATMPGIIAMASAFIFAIVFSFFINLYVISPIIQLTSGIRDYMERGKPLNIRVESEDEISMLVSSVEQLINKSKI